MSGFRPDADEPADPLQRPTLVVGAGLALAGIVVMVAPGVAAWLPGDDLVILGVGAVTLLVGLSLLFDRRDADKEGAETGDPEARRPLPVPGEELEADLQSVDGLRRIPDATRERIRTRLFEAAVAVVRRRERVSRSAAEQRVRRGAWTDDPDAARFLAADEADSLPEQTVRNNLSKLLAAGSRFGLESRRTADAILRLAGRTDQEDTTADAEDLSPGPAGDDRRRPFNRETRRWAGVGGLGLAAGGLGVVTNSPGLVLVAAVGVTYAAYAAQARPQPVEVAVERSLSVVGGDGSATGASEVSHDADGDGGETDDEGGPRITASDGDLVEVTLTVENVGDRTLADVRLVDGVPAALEVAEGSPRLGTALRPGRSATLTYAVEAEHGDHEFGPVQVLARDPSGSHEREVAVEAPGGIVSLPDFAEMGTVPLHGTATRYTGRISTDSGGEGVEFHSTREYRPGDPPGRIDWNRHARTRELATLLFREERAATVVLLVDTREEAYYAPGPGDTHAVEHGVEAAGALFGSLLDGGDRVGLASFGPEWCWVPPGAGNDQRERVRRALATDDAFGYDPPDRQFLPSARLADLRRRAPVDAQFVLVTPLLDDYVETVARRLQAHGHPMTVVSPDVTADGALGHRLVQVERQSRLNRLREAGVRVVDWDPDERLDVAFTRASKGWSA